MTNSPSPVAFIAGITGGIGTALARQLHAAGWRVSGWARDSVRLQALAAELPGLHTMVVDATDPGAVATAVQAAREHHGRLDGYVHAIGSILLKNAQQTSLEEWHRTLTLNLTTAFVALKAVLGPLQEGGGGACVFVSSVAAKVGLPNHEAIAAAKGGLEGLVRAAAASYAHRNIRINAVAPGLVDTPLAAPLLASEAGRKISAALHPLGRVGRADQVAGLIAWLLSPAGDWVTGEVWSIDGGMAHVRPRPKV
jgi:NAD(P)-dependent dehydrogenase (short-subunit alcohol dehydrogenase family)